jgi:hypothetical protein
MKKTSRRNFAKSIMAAAAAAPVALSTKAAASAQSHQDTPPPIQILDGSLIVESMEEFTETTPGSRFQYTLTTDPLIEHIRVISDNGDKIYEDLEASAGTISSAIELVWVNEDKNATGTVKISGGSVFKIDSDKKLDKSSQKKRRKFKYEHPGNGNNKRIRIESIEITNVRGRKTKITAFPTGSGDNFLPEEFRILIWR